MQWEQLTSADFKKAADETGVCVMAMGVIEKHGDHLPLGTDYLNGHTIACMAAEKEPAIVYPQWYFGQIYEARSFPGTVTIPPRLLIELMDTVFDEISRNGIKKILLLNAHGGNNSFIQFLCQTRLAEKRDYSLYAVVPPMSHATQQDDPEAWDAIIEENWGGHGHEAETAWTLANHEHTVRMDQAGEPAHPMGRTKHLKELFTGINWYGDHPEHYSGDGSKATVAKGEAIRARVVDKVAGWIKLVKEDKAVPGLLNEFYDRSVH